MKYRLLLLFVVLCAEISANAQSVGWLELKKTTSSEGAEVYVDGMYMTDIPSKIMLPAGNHEIVVKRDLYLEHKASVKIESGKDASMSVNLEKNYNYVTFTVPMDAKIRINGKVVGVRTWSGNLKCGEYQVTAEMPGHISTTSAVNVVVGRAQNITLPSPRVLKGDLRVTSDVDGAMVYLDGSYIGTTPLQTNVVVGDHLVELNGMYVSEEENMVTVAQKGMTEVHFNNREMAQFTVSTNVSNASLLIDGSSSVDGHQYKMELGKHEVSVSASGFKPRSKTVNLKSGSNYEYIKLQEYYFGNTLTEHGLYVDVGCQAMRFPGLEFSLGGYIYGFNLQLDVVAGLKKTPEVSYFTYNGDAIYRYRPNRWNFKFGWGFPLGTRLKATPQIGFGRLFLSGKCVGGADMDKEFDDDIWRSEFAAGARLDIAVAPNVAVYVNPAYVVGMGKSDLFQSVMAVSPMLARWCSGFNASVGVCFYVGSEVW